ncbi:ABC-2 type transport system permease protein [Thiobacillus denitrificans ATCC 25259]|uniref:ABC-2 type transport system permease protein n=1 Tax=Thiobacillus denitrificans (strain ATCC 25259 / T1) TaxID=292415 RepID=Q3SJW4_THIDA|nr:ABC transporter permease [Thiobacillus denitrificans]AAZ97035.1 ABC-2 type transport system permease protein [Thiobacillus denitrificans ATCC 25259]
MRSALAWHRLWAIVLKEFVQMRRDRITFAMMVGIPVIQLVLFGFAINTDPKRLPTVVFDASQSAYSRSFVASLENSGYFNVLETPSTVAEAREALAIGEVQFIVSIPPDFSRQLIRGEKPVLLLEADASDPAATGNALSALATINQTALQHDLKGPLAPLAGGPAPFEIRVQRNYNPEGITQYNIVPGLMGTILTMTMIMMTGMAMTRELERGTMENLLAFPVHPLEVMIGKILPYIIVGYIQVAVILIAAHFLFGVPIAGSLSLLLASVLVFLAANLTVGMMFSTLAKSQLQAMQMTFFFFLPSMLLSGFMFPFRGMPHWAQVIGEALPLTHFLRIVRGIMLKGNGWAETWPNVWPLLLFMAIVMAIGFKRYRKTLD